MASSAPTAALTAAAPISALAAAAPIAELIRLDRLPSGWAHSVSIGRLAPSIDDERLAQVLSDCGGPVANLLLHCAPDRRWATAQFFCEADAERFRTSCDGRPFAGQRIEVKRLFPSSRGGGSTAVAIPGDTFILIRPPRDRSTLAATGVMVYAALRWVRSASLSPPSPTFSEEARSI